MEPTNTPYSGERFKDDVKPRSIRGFNTRDVKVRRQSVGYLDNNYFGGRIVLQPKYFAHDYTRIPPLSATPNLLNGRSISLKLSRRLLEIWTLTSSFLKNVLLWTETRTLQARQALWQQMPKSYSINRGVFVDWVTVRAKALNLLLTLVSLALVLGIYLELNHMFTLG